MAKAVTIRDVAERAGVSIATVSRVLNGAGTAAPDTAERVRTAVAELGFRPNRIGSSLKAARTRTLGVVIPSLSNPVFADSVAGVQDAAADAGYSLLIASTDYDPGREAQAVESLLSHRVEGLVLTVADADGSAVLDTLDAADLPYVLVYNQPRASGRPFVSVDNVAAARTMVERMIALGHTRIGMVAGRFRQSDRSRLRHDGYRAALDTAGLAPGPLIEVDFADAAPERRLAVRLDGPDRPTALFGSNDLVALATVRALRDLGLAVPADVSVTGFDGIAVGALVSPALTTLVQPARAMGARAMQDLLAHLAGGPRPGQVTLPFSVRTGETLGPAPALRTSGPDLTSQPDARI
ncbi:LacI family DNA-binding transcriptional regulator [Azospirillum halopraeferens]|uniref:LacI family DNA-binding transcriptional regulator n=1 Tax=Azospirillum halopraeferens TaxID=34010 RepID=UPI00048D193E|nr:LacI family DNA-binding transcriptional regulator [Azospirillum halopraeferens]